jgi:hypothetical protein
MTSITETITRGFAIAESDHPAADSVREVLAEFDYSMLSPEEWRTVLAASFDAKARVAEHKKPERSWVFTA